MRGRQHRRGGRRPAALDPMEHDAVDVVGVDQLEQRAILEEHGVHRMPHADQRALGEALDRIVQIVLKGPNEKPNLVLPQDQQAEYLGFEPVSIPH